MPRAVNDFRRQHGIAEPIEEIDWNGVRWRREDEPEPKTGTPGKRPARSRRRARAGRRGRGAPHIPTERELELEQELEALRGRVESPGGTAARSRGRPGEGSAVELPLPSEEYMRLVSGGRSDDLEAHFEWVGGVLAAMLKNAEMLEPGSRLLDIGCGCGRVARHLLDAPLAGYAGFDRHPGMIEWAQAHIGARDDRFRFQHVDVVSVYKEVDGQTGVVPAAEFVFP